MKAYSLVLMLVVGVACGEPKPHQPNYTKMGCLRLLRESHNHADTLAALQADPGVGDVPCYIQLTYPDSE